MSLPLQERSVLSLETAGRMDVLRSSTVFSEDSGLGDSRSEDSLVDSGHSGHSVHTSCPSPRLCLFGMCTHALNAPHLCIADTLDSPLTLKKSAKSYICTPNQYTPLIPQELIDAILLSIPPTDTPTLRACAQVCWAFVPAARASLFRTLTIDMLSPSHAPNLHLALARTPTLARYVRDVTIYRSHDTNLWMLPGSPLPGVLHTLAAAGRITRFSIFGCWGNWRDVPPPLSDAILRACALPTLERLHILTAANMPPALFASALRVRVLSLFHCSVDPRLPGFPAQREDDARRAGPTYLNLSLDGQVGKILDAMLADSVGAASSPRSSPPRSPSRAPPQGGYFDNVTRLALNPIPNSVNSADNLAKVLRAVEGTLEVLEVQVHERHIPPLPPLPPRTTRFALHLIMETPGALLPADLPSILASVRATSPRLTRLEVVLHLPFFDASTPTDGIPNAAVLRGVDGVLAAWATRAGEDGGGGGTGREGLRAVRVRVVPEGPAPDYVRFVGGCLVRTEQALAARSTPSSSSVGGTSGGEGWEEAGLGLTVEQGSRERGTAVMPLLPHTSVWPHRKK
ncbi:hypothetical protein DFH07DRAFT_812752 [Mycena maculata]|uniref:F-box domain-containing protein n=1 Tax=Mycena maculata TaxID=230809 RepID=A0AAD7JGR7_9AGAR|nr:hypothetical protein DFH07DRAFT_812752 [Mycena maculata]